MRRVLALLICLVAALGGCGSSGESVGQAAERWCGDHWGKSAKTEDVCFTTIFERPNPGRFLETIEEGEAIKAEIKSLKP